jgi:peroxiredoxin
MNLTVGDEFPDFELMDFRGNKFHLSDFRGDSNVILVFMPAGPGWLNSRWIARKIHQHHDELVDSGITVLVISQNSPKSFERYWSERRLKFIGVPDPDYSFSSSVARLVGQGEHPPPVLVLDKQGVIRFLSYREVKSGKIIVDDIPANYLTPGAG